MSETPAPHDDAHETSAGQQSDPDRASDNSERESTIEKPPETEQPDGTPTENPSGG